jgi:hypothetical protein
MKKVNRPGINISLTSWEMLLAAQSGIMRQIQNIRADRKPAHGAGTERDWQFNVEGCLGEYALSKHMGLYWSGEGFRKRDVGIYEVRTGPKPNSSLLLHKEDYDNRYYWLLCGLNGRYEIKGWIIGRDGKKDEYWEDPVGGRPAYFVPQDVLHSPYEEPK